MASGTDNQLLSLAGDRQAARDKVEASKASLEAAEAEIEDRRAKLEPKS